MAPAPSACGSAARRRIPTVVIDGQDSSEIWSGFRVGRRARPFGIDLRDEGGVLIATGAHDGYRHLTGSPVHRRTWELGDDGLILRDQIKGRANHLAEVLLHLAPRADGRSA